MSERISLKELAFHIWEGFLFLLKFTTLLKLALFGLSVIGYSFILSWEFTIILVVSIFTHELGHALALRWLGMKSDIYLVPFLGGITVNKESYKTRCEEITVAISGPILGLVMAIVMLYMYSWSAYELWLIGAAWVAFLNVFNLLPVSPLDGGKILKALMFSMNKITGTIYFATILIVAYALCGLTQSIIPAILAFIVFFEIAGEYKKHQVTVDLTNIQIVTFITVYASLTGTLLSILDVTINLAGPKLLQQVLLHHG